MQIIRLKDELRALTRDWRAAGQTIGVVPTMGALHDGHLSLVAAAKARHDRVIVTLFVNPRQFNNPEDLKKYPRTEDSDAQKLAPLAVDALYVPDPGQIYPEGFATTISVGGVSAGLCGADRPGHFDGVATVVTKLLNQTDADEAFFGEKDFQQLQVVRRLVADLDLKAGIVACPTLRESDGLAMSSRNQRLGPRARIAAPAIFAALSGAAAKIAGGAPAGPVLEAARLHLLAAGFSAVDYLELRRESDLAPMPSADAPGRIFVAAWLDGVRLIDNLALPLPPDAAMPRGVSRAPG